MKLLSSGIIDGQRDMIAISQHRYVCLCWPERSWHISITLLMTDWQVMAGNRGKFSRIWLRSNHDLQLFNQCNVFSLIMSLPTEAFLNNLASSGRRIAVKSTWYRSENCTWATDMYEKKKLFPFVVLSAANIGITDSAARDTYSRSLLLFSLLVMPRCEYRDILRPENHRKKISLVLALTLLSLEKWQKWNKREDWWFVWVMFVIISFKSTCEDKNSILTKKRPNKTKERQKILYGSTHRKFCYIRGIKSVILGIPNILRSPLSEHIRVLCEVRTLGTTRGTHCLVYA